MSRFPPLIAAAVRNMHPALGVDQTLPRQQEHARQAALHTAAVSKAFISKTNLITMNKSGLRSLSLLR